MAIEDLEMQPLPASSPINLYAAIPILGRSIRVLDLDYPSSSNFNSPLSGQIRSVSLDQHHRFTALSYVWNPPSAPRIRHSITCRGVKRSQEHEIDISSNCNVALRHIRERYGSVSIWVDAICINQDDIKEKGHQVALMKDIFTSAEPVYVWLGPGNERTDRAMRYLSRQAKCLLSSYHIRCHQSAGWDKILRLVYYLLAGNVSISILMPWSLIAPCFYQRFKGQNRFDFASVNILHPQDSIIQIDLQDLLNRDWIRRIWTFQELTLATNIEILCGQHVIHCTDLFESLTVLKSVIQNSPNAAKLPKSVETWLSLRDVWVGTFRSVTRQKSIVDCELRNGHWQWPRSCWLESTLIIYLTLEWISFDVAMCLLAQPASAVVAISIGLPFVSLFVTISFMYFATSSRFGEFPGQNEKVLSGILQAMRERQATDPLDRSYALYGILQNEGLILSDPDYSKGIETVYHEVFVDLVKWEASILRLIVDAGRLPVQFPSWVPNFNEPLHSWLVYDYYYGTNKCSATAGSNSRLTLLNQNTALQVQGILKGEVLFCCHHLLGLDVDYSSPRFPSTLEHNILLFLRWFTLIRHVAYIDSACHSLQTAVYCTIFTVTDGENDLDSQDFTNLCQFFMDRPITQSESSEETDLATTLVEEMLENTQVLDYFANICAILATERSLFVTSEGHVGSSRQNIAQGDTVGLIAGVGVPMILRLVEGESNQFTVISPAYIHGLMKGEQWSEELVRDITLV